VHVSDAVEGSYCSQACYYREQGGRFLQNLRRRHELCGTCFRLTKDIERPREEWLDRHLDANEYGWTLNEDEYLRALHGGDIHR